MKKTTVYLLLVLSIVALVVCTAVAMPSQKPLTPNWYEKVSVPLNGRLDVECKDGFLYLEGMAGDVYQWRCIR